ncbi:MAG: hypothetical protein PWQ63_1495 [Methanolobus sp.]|nr:hypothetical protein [Methanolobus sp.]
MPLFTNIFPKRITTFSIKGDYGIKRKKRCIHEGCKISIYFPRTILAISEPTSDVPAEPPIS